MLQGYTTAFHVGVGLLAAAAVSAWGFLRAGNSDVAPTLGLAA